MRRVVVCFALALCVVPAALAFADDGLRWRRTTPRASFAESAGRLELRVPPERAWGIAAAPLRLDAGGRYHARATLAVPPDTLRGAFLRVALYPTADGRGRQRRVLDSPLVSGGADPVSVDFLAPGWARTAKLRVLARGLAELSAPFAAWDVALGPLRAPPEVVLRDGE